MIISEFLLLLFLFVTTPFCQCDAQGKQKLCPRTHKSPGNFCEKKCDVDTGCSDKKKDCVCDGNCGYSCVSRKLKCRALRRRFKNGVMDWNGNRTFNTTVTYTCNKGYTMTGSAVRTCRGGGYWDGAETKCRMFCADPGIGANLHRYQDLKTKGFKVRTSLQYYCTLCYKLDGPEIITCLPSGQWTGQPKCKVVTCPTIKLPENAKVVIPRNYKTSRESQCGSTVTLGCESGYTLQNGQRGSMKCEINGEWKMTSTHKCRPRTCKRPGYLPNGKRHGLLFHFMQRVNYTCDHCYKLRGSEFRTCQANGQWTGSQPVCERIKCDKLGSLKNGKMTFPSTAGRVSNDCGARVHFECYHGYNLMGSKQRECGLDGKWTGNATKCKAVSCGVPKKLNTPGLITIGKDYHYGSIVQFKCNGTLVGQNTVKCMANGSWSHETPHCLVSCVTPVGDNGKKIVKHGETVKFTCPSGKELVGLINNKEATCHDGVWKQQGDTIDVAKVKCLQKVKPKKKLDIFG